VSTAWGPSVEDALEEDLMAERGYRELWVEFSWGEERRVRTFPGTPEWRVAADKLADEFREDPDVVRVWNVPMKGSPAEVSIRTTDPVASAGAPSSLEDSKAAHPARWRSNICRSCRPKFRHGPSGKGLWHAHDCAISPGRKISMQEYVQGRQWTNLDFRRGSRV
jgi:hypothetical protein